VVNHECPEDEKAYLHRIGRTGRAGRTVIAVTFVDWQDMARWKLINETLNLGHPEPLETYSTSEHLFTALGIPASARGSLPSAKRGRAGLEAEDLEDIGSRFDGAPDLEFRAATEALELDSPRADGSQAAPPPRAPAVPFTASTAKANTRARRRTRAARRSERRLMRHPQADGQAHNPTTATQLTPAVGRGPHPGRRPASFSDQPRRRRRSAAAAVVSLTSAHRRRPRARLARRVQPSSATSRRLSAQREVRPADYDRPGPGRSV
jgi:superfamily II DNA/RNA helicase